MTRRRSMKPCSGEGAILEEKPLLRCKWSDSSHSIACEVEDWVCYQPISCDYSVGHFLHLCCVVNREALFDGSMKHKLHSQAHVILIGALMILFPTNSKERFHVTSYDRMHSFILWKDKKSQFTENVKCWNECYKGIVRHEALSISTFTHSIVTLQEASCTIKSANLPASPSFLHISNLTTSPSFLHISTHNTFMFELSS